MEMSSSVAVVIGDLLVFKGMGLVRVEGEHDREGAPCWSLTCLADSVRLSIPKAGMPEFARRPVARAEAERLVALLQQQSGACDERPWKTRFREHEEARLEGSLEDQASALHRLYRTT